MLVSGCHGDMEVRDVGKWLSCWKGGHMFQSVVMVMQRSYMLVSSCHSDREDRYLVSGCHGKRGVIDVAKWLFVMVTGVIYVGK